MEEKEQKCIDCPFYMINELDKNHYCLTKYPYIKNPEEVNDCDSFGYTWEEVFDESD